MTNANHSVYSKIPNDWYFAYSNILVHLHTYTRYISQLCILQSSYIGIQTVPSLGTHFPDPTLGEPAWVHWTSVECEEPGGYIPDEPAHAGQQVLAGDRGAGLDAPVVRGDLVQVQLPLDLAPAQAVGQVRLVGEDEQRCAQKTLLLHTCPQD